MPANNPNLIEPPSHHISISLYRKIAISFLGLTLAVIAIILYFSTATATITITPERTDWRSDFIFSVKPAGDDEITFVEGDGKVRGRVMEATKQGSKEFPTSIVSEGDPAKATGTVTLINKSSRPQQLVATTRLLSKEGVLFRLVAGVTVPANGEIDAAVAADQPGKQGEIGPSQFSIPGLNPTRQTEVYAISKTAMTGGTKPVQMMNDADFKRAQDELAAELASQAIVEWEAILPAELKVLPSSVFKEVLSSSSSAKVGDKVEKFTLTISVRVAGLAAEEKEIVRVAMNRLKQTIPSDRELLEVDESTLQYSAEKYDAPSRTLSLKASLAGKTQVRSSSPVFDKSKLAGKSVADATAYLKQLPGVEDVRIKLSPFWVTRIPNLKDHIRIVVEK